MARRPLALGLSGIFVCLLPACILLGSIATTAMAAPPVVQSAVSRMTHTSAGTAAAVFDIQLPLTGGSGIECRSVTAGMTIVLTFDQPVTGGGASIAAGTASVNGNPVFSTNTMTVSLTGVADAQALTLSLDSITNAAAESILAQTVPFRVLVGDINANGVLSGSDVNICKAAVASAVAVNGANFRCDVNANGLLSGSDVNMVKAAAANGTMIGGKGTTNTPPTVSAIANQQAVTGQPSSPVGFTVADAESNPATLYASATSSDQTTVPNANISITGTGSSRTINVTPASGITVVTPVTITVTASDGLALSPGSSFTLTVVPPPTTFLATLSPIPGVNSLGAGSATLQLSGDKKSVILKYSVSNLAGADTDDTINSAANAVLYDVPVGKSHGDLQPDGSLKWIFSAGEASAAVAAIESETSYMLIDTAAFPAGELKGTFKKVVGSQTFSPPDPPPAITINPPSSADASRFLQQAAFGGTFAEISALSNTNAANAATALNDWLTAQFALPGPIYPTYANAVVAPTTQPVAPPGAQSTTQPYTASSMYYQMYVRVAAAQSPNVYGDNLDNNLVHEAWWKNVVTAPDQLRQRVATALSEILVVSGQNDVLDGQIPGICTYYDMLADNAFGNFRQLLGEVTLHPIMGEYLNMRGNKKATPPASPNENYAREILQLFSIGLYMLQPDGTLMLDANGQPIPTYDQTTITNFAQVFTGWNLDSVAVPIPLLTSPSGATVNFNSSYQKPMAVTGSNHSTLRKDLLVYPGAKTYPSATQPSVIPSTSGTPSAAVCNNELNFALDNIFYHPNVGPFISKQLIQRLITSNPSPGYVYRVAKIFDDDNTAAHVRGNLQAVAQAILTDYEARSPALLSQPGYGHMREPMIRIANILRSCNAYSKSGKWHMGQTDATLAQTILRSPTVFNFFDPKFSASGVVQQAGLVSPEFDIIYETTVTLAHNMIYTGIYASYNADGTVKSAGGTGFRGDSAGTDIYLDFSTAGNGLVALAQSGGTGALIDRVALLLNGPPLDPVGGSSTPVKTRIQTFLTSLTAGDYLGQARAAVHLIATSPNVTVEK